MSTLNLTYSLLAGTPEDIGQVQQNFTDIRNWANGGIDATNVTNDSITNDKLDDTTVLNQLGLSSTGVIRRGKSIIATEEARTNTAYGTLTTPDQVANVVLPTDGLIVVAYRALWKESVDTAAKAAIFIGADQLKASASSGAPVVAETSCGGDANVYSGLWTHQMGLGGPANGATATLSDVTTGQTVAGLVTTFDGGPCHVFAAAGTYTISVQFKASSGSVTVKERKLWVRTIGF